LKEIQDKTNELNMMDEVKPEPKGLGRLVLNKTEEDRTMYESRAKLKNELKELNARKSVLN